MRKATEWKPLGARWALSWMGGGVGSGLLSLSHNTQEAGVAGPSHTMSYDGTG